MTCSSYTDFFSNFANQTKLDIILLLISGPLSVNVISEKTNQEQSTVSHNLRKLCDCNILDVENKGRERIYSVNKDSVLPMLKLVGNHVSKYCKGGCCKK